MLTAAHCYDGNGYWVCLGDTDLSHEYDDTHALEVSADDFITHPVHRRHQSYFDVGVLVLERRVNFTDFILPVCTVWVVPMETPDHLAGKLVTLTGWWRRRMNN